MHDRLHGEPLSAAADVAAGTLPIRAILAILYGVSTRFIQMHPCKALPSRVARVSGLPASASQDAVLEPRTVSHQAGALTGAAGLFLKAGPDHAENPWTGRGPADGAGGGSPVGHPAAGAAVSASHSRIGSPA